MGILSKSYATDGCYSTFTSRFYYISIGTNNYSGSTYATSGRFYHAQHLLQDHITQTRHAV